VSEPIRILVVVRKQLLRDGLSALIQSQTGMQLAGSIANGDHAAQLFLVVCPEVLLLDLDLPHIRAIDTIREIVAARPSACIIGLLPDEMG
jgi:chemotaxis response regulator CheB